MAVETLVVQPVNRTGAVITLASITIANGFRFLNDGRSILYMVNDAGAIVLNFTIQPTIDSETVPTKTVTVTASETWRMGPFPTKWYNDADGYCEVSTDQDLVTGTAIISVPGVG